MVNFDGKIYRQNSKSYNKYDSVETPTILVRESKKLSIRKIFSGCFLYSDIIKYFHVRG